MKQDTLVGWLRYRREGHLQRPLPAPPGPGGDAHHRCLRDILLHPCPLLIQAEAGGCLHQVGQENLVGYLRTILYFTFWRLSNHGVLVVVLAGTVGTIFRYILGARALLVHNKSTALSALY